MHFEDVLAALAVGPVEQHLAIEAPRAQQRRVEDFRTVRCRKQNHAHRRVEAVELAQQLVERLLLFVRAAADRRDAAGAAERVELVDEDDAGRRLAGLLEQIADPCGADADEHLDEFRSADREEGDARFARDGAGDQRLAGSGRAD